MLYELNNTKDEKYIRQYGKAYGVQLLHKWLPNISNTKNLFVLNSYEEFKKIENKLPEKFTCRADAKIGEPPTLVEGSIVRKENVEEYIRRVKQNNANGVVLCIDTKDGTQERIKTDGAFNVYFEMYDKIFIDYVGKGFDVGAITKGRENHETWMIDWEKLLFVTPNNMNEYREHLISNDEYLTSARRRLKQLLNIGYSRENIQGKIPKTYLQMPLSIKEMILDDIVLPMYCQSQNLKRNGIESFGIQGMIINHKLHPIEINRRERFADKSIFEIANNMEKER